MVIPSSTYACDTYRSFRFRLSVCSALAMALASTLYTGSLAAWGANCNVDSASSTAHPADQVDDAAGLGRGDPDLTRDRVRTGTVAEQRLAAAGT